MKIEKYFLILLALLCTGSIYAQTIPYQRIDLSGKWNFAIDSTDVGVSQKWYDSVLKDHITLPGSMTSNNKGDEVSLSTHWTGQIVDQSFFTSPKYAKYRVANNFKVPFWLQPIKYYVGPAWYQKEITIPASWNKKAIRLFLERCHWESTLWIDNQEIGMRNSLGVPHVYELFKKLKPGNHRLTLRIDNRIKDIDPGINSHSLTDHTQGNWNGMIGYLYLEARPLIAIDHTAVYTDIKKKSVTAKVCLMNYTSGKNNYSLAISVGKDSLKTKIHLKPGMNEIQITLPLGDHLEYWSEFHPSLYNLRLTINNKKGKLIDEDNETFGVRELTAIGRQLMLNGKPLFLRGTLNCAAYPLTGYPPTDLAAWLRFYKICRAHGLNHVRFHSWCPPDAAFTAADKMGFYLEIECSSWANMSTTLGDGKPIDQYIMNESKRMVETYGNHPSFCMLEYGNEPGGIHFIPYLTKFVNYWKTYDSRRFYSTSGGWPNIPESDYLCDSKPRIQSWGQGLKSIINAEAPRTDYDWSNYINSFNQPMISHEIGQWCAYPNFKEIPKYKGVLHACNFEFFKETLSEHGMANLADSFLLASGKLQTLCYKADIEAALRTKDFGGFQLLGLNDFPGQGTALVGVLDAFWDEKGYSTPEDYRHFCNSTVPLARMKKLIYTNNEYFKASIEVAHYEDTPLMNCTPKWKITDNNGQVLYSGRFSTTNIPIGNCTQLGRLNVLLKDIVTPEQLNLSVSVGSAINDWNFWVYPHHNPTLKESIPMIDHLDSTILKRVKMGTTVLLSLKEGTLSNEMGGNVKIGFSSIFWNTAWTSGQPPHTLGILCNPHHPALAEFPTNYYSDYQWWDSMSHSGAINIGKFTAKVQPLVRVIDDWFTNRPLALLFEAKIGKGKLIISGIDFWNNMQNRPEARQLLYSLETYMESSSFNPTCVFEKQDIATLLKLTTIK